MSQAAARSTSDEDGLEGVVLDAVRALAQETSGPRTAQAAKPSSSLERELGLGSLERVELLSRLERLFGKPLDESMLRLDTPRDLARAIAEAGGASGPRERHVAPAVAVAADLGPFSTVHQALWRRAEADPERPHVYMREDDGREHVITYGRLLLEARRIASGLREIGVARGDAVALMLPTGLDFLRSFQGILICGAIPVPIYPPVRLDRLEEYLKRQSAILTDASARVLVTIPRAASIGQVMRSSVPTLTQIVSPDVLAQSGIAFGGLEGDGSDTAFVQYTSGSTGQPKGVTLTHTNLLANIAGIDASLQPGPSDVGVSWLPLYHDMGLIGSWLFCLCRGIPIDIQSPLSFLARPERWLWAIHRRRATLSAGPNFAYELCVRKIRDEDIEGLDLSTWRCALNGAEPVSPDTLERFASRFARYGFRKEALMPVYGLAENSVALCFPPLGRGPKIDRVERHAFEAEGRAAPASPEDTALEFPSEGPPIPGHEVRILDDSGADLPERRVGRLVFRGPSMTTGYYNNPEATAAITLPGGWLDSGDLAYVANGEVHISGRRKDIIIKAGRNIVPHEIEEAVAEVAGVRKGCVVAFGVPQVQQGTEALVVVAETRAANDAARDRIVAAVRERVDQAIGLPPDAVVLVPPGAVPKTSSGKIRRASAKDAYIAGSLGHREALRLSVKMRLLWGVLRAKAEVVASGVARGGYAAYVVGALGIAAPVVWLLVRLIPGQRFARRLERVTLRYVTAVCGCRLSVEGLEHLEQSGPAVLASNHTSYADIPLLRAMIPRPFLFVSKKEALAYPLVGVFLRRVGHLTVDRFDAQASVANTSKVVEALQRGESVLVFPEATFTSTDGLRPFKLGAFKTAVDAGVPVVPMALSGSRRVLRDGSWVPRPRRVRLWIGAPIVANGSDWRSILDLRDRTADAIAAHCGEPRLDLVAAGAERPS